MTLLHSSLCKWESLETGIFHGEVLQHFLLSSTNGAGVYDLFHPILFPCSTVVTGPVTHYLYQFLEGLVPKRGKYSSVKKAFLDRLLFAPPYLLALFYFVAIMEVIKIVGVRVLVCQRQYHFKNERH